MSRQIAKKPNNSERQRGALKTKGEVKTELKLFGPQFDAYNFKTRFAAAVAGVQSGKTFLGANWAMKKMQEFPAGTGIIAAPTYKILQAATLKKLFDLEPTFRSWFKEQKGEIHLPTGGIIYVRSADSPLGIEGITADWAWLDEGGMASVLTWTVLRSRVSMTGGQILITTTPYNMGWLYQDFFVPWREKQDKALSFFTWKSVDNPYYDKEFYEAEKKRLSPEEFGRRYMGEFRKMTGLVWDLPHEQIIEPIEGLIKKSDARIMGIDWGWRNPAGIIVAVRYDDAWYIVDEWKKAEKTTAEILQVASNMAKEYKVQRVYPDPAEPDRVHEAKRERLPVYDTNKDVLGGLSTVRQLIYEKRFFVYNKCKETIDEMSMYHYPESGLDEGKEDKELPEKFNDHLMDALRYAIYSHGQVRKTPAVASEPISGYYKDREMPF